jgi:hypothetical protein
VSRRGIVSAQGMSSPVDVDDTVQSALRLAMRPKVLARAAIAGPRNVTRAHGPLQLSSSLSSRGWTVQQRDPATSCRSSAASSPFAQRPCRGRTAPQMLIVHANNRHDAMVSLPLCPCPGTSSRCLHCPCRVVSRIKPEGIKSPSRAIIPQYETSTNSPTK